VTEYGNRQQQNFSHNHPKSPLWILAKKSCRRLAEEGCNRTIGAEGEIATDKRWTMNEMPQSAASPRRTRSRRDRAARHRRADFRPGAASRECHGGRAAPTRPAAAGAIQKRISNGVRGVGRALVSLAGTAQALRRAAGREAEHPPGLRGPGKEPNQTGLKKPPLRCSAVLYGCSHHLSHMNRIWIHLLAGLRPLPLKREHPRR
jgi:hypothetical protein